MYESPLVATAFLGLSYADLILIGGILTALAAVVVTALLTMDTTDKVSDSEKYPLKREKKREPKEAVTGLTSAPRSRPGPVRHSASAPRTSSRPPRPSYSSSTPSAFATDGTTAAMVTTIAAATLF